MSYRKDDGSTVTGIIFVVFCVASFAMGYWIRDQGVIFQINQTQPQQEVQE
jgi:preprotein translocase subunit SecG